MMKSPLLNGGNLAFSSILTLTSYHVIVLETSTETSLTHDPSSLIFPHLLSLIEILSLLPYQFFDVKYENQLTVHWATEGNMSFQFDMFFHNHLNLTDIGI